MSNSLLYARIRYYLTDGAASTPGADAAISEIANWIASCFATYLNDTRVTQVKSERNRIRLAPGGPYVCSNGTARQLPGGMVMTSASCP
jgi:hypothetical protein